MQRRFIMFAGIWLANIILLIALLYLATQGEPGLPNYAAIRLCDVQVFHQGRVFIVDCS